MTTELHTDAALPPPSRRIYCNRTLNLRSVKAIGCDMDYTLIHYRTEAWEQSAYEHMRHHLREAGLPVEELAFDPTFATLGLVIDLELGNIVKANRFGFVRRACHGTRLLDFDDQRRAYARELIELSEPRWVFMNTLFGLSEACMYAQLVDLSDAGRIDRALSYADLYRHVRVALDATHMEGTLKSEIVADPERFVVLDPELPLALLDQKRAGKKLLLITNSEWSYARAMMGYAFDRFLPEGMSWRELFDIVIVGARKPAFFSTQSPIFELVSEEGLLDPYHGKLKEGGVYLGGSADLVERDLGFRGEEILYIGDHMFADVHVSKSLLRWRTALVVRELEPELAALEAFRPKQALLSELMAEKELLEHRYSLLRLDLQRLEGDYGGAGDRAISGSGAAAGLPAADELRRAMQALRSELVELDQRIAPLAREGGELVNPRWGLIMRAGNDKSQLARQIERYADIYTSRVSNLLGYTPFVYLRSPHASLPHDG